MEGHWASIEASWKRFGNCRKTTGRTKNFSKMPGNDIPDLPSWSPQLELDKHQLTQHFDESESPKFTIGSHSCSCSGFVHK